jgi:hypothetical protein
MVNKKKNFSHSLQEASMAKRKKMLFNAGDAVVFTEDTLCWLSVGGRCQVFLKEGTRGVFQKALSCGVVMVSVTVNEKKLLVNVNESVLKKHTLPPDFEHGAIVRVPKQCWGLRHHDCIQPPKGVPRDTEGLVVKLVQVDGQWAVVVLVEGENGCRWTRNPPNIYYCVRPDCLVLVD